MTPKEFEIKMNTLAENRKDFAKKLKVSNGLVAGMITGSHTITQKTIDKIEKLEKGESIQIKTYPKKDSNGITKDKRSYNTIWKLSCKSFEITGSKESILYFLKGE